MIDGSLRRRSAELAFYGFALTSLTVTPFLSLAGGFDRVWNWLNDISLPSTMLGLGLLIGRTDRRVLRARVRRLWPFAAMVALAALSVLWSVNPNRTVYETMRFGVATAIGLVMAVRTTLVERVVVVGATLSVGLAVSHALGWKWPEVGVYAPNGRWQGWYGHPTFLGSVAVLAVPCLFVGLWRRGWLRWLAGVFLYLAVVLMTRAEAKTAIIVCLLLAVLAGMRAVVAGTRSWSRVARRAGGGGAAAGLAFASLAVAVGNANLWQRLREHRTLSERTILWRALRPWIEQEWWRGFGLGGFFSDGGGYATHARRAAQSPALVNAHSGYLQTWLDFGIVGLLLMVGILGVGLVRAARHTWAARADASTIIDIWPLLAILGIILLNGTEPKFAGPEHLHWIVLILAMDAVGALDGANIAKAANAVKARST